MKKFGFAAAAMLFVAGVTAFAQSAPAISVTVGTNAVAPGDVVLVPDTPVGNTTPPITFTVTNTGKSALTAVGVNPTVVTRGDAAMFVFNGSKTATTLSPGQRTHFTVTFTPMSSGHHVALVVLRTNDPNTPDFTFVLTGNGVSDGSSWLSAPGAGKPPVL